MGYCSSPNSSADDLKKHVMEVFEEATKDCEDEYLTRVFGTIADYNSLNGCAIKLFDAVGGIGITDKAKELFKPVSNLGILCPVAIFTMVIMIYSDARNAKGALKVYRHMIATGVTPVSFTYTILISTLAQDFSDVKFLGYAKKYFLEMLDKGMKPNPTPYINVMDAIAYRETEEKAKVFLEQIKAKGFVPPEHGFQYKEGHFTETFQALKMYAHLLYNDATDKDVKVFFRFMRNHTGTHKKLANKMYNALVEDGNVNEALEFYNTIQETGAEPLILIHTSVIKTYLEFGKTRSALEAYLAMLAAGVAPNSYTCTVLIKGLSADPNFLGDAK
ncbi:pentatricopeptide repeat-containing protein At1g18900-like [Rosa rugosa]|uniref:pentatricopeptide repeat-containing protein At1g18900-like n=1 Tax=Rosa rugosa TaxID=74645 RepID=UPI002B4089ED|nr:pentatricopeptide repeat-containing protein At1g18900-like [Rosa rugosa]XP_062029811.1 pentatricopeptide repeat-containing protein At1g18900-like [Rosa rugosa]